MSIWDEWAKNPLYGKLASDPQYLALTPAFKKSIHDILFRAGVTPTGEQTDLAGGAVENNQYSLLNALRTNHDNADHSSINAANASGLEESGAAVGALNANTEDFKRNQSELYSQVGSQIGDALRGYASSVGDIFGRLEADPAPPLPDSNPTGLRITGGGTAADPTIVRSPPGMVQPTTPNVQNPWHVPVTIKPKKPAPIRGSHGLAGF